MVRVVQISGEVHENVIRTLRDCFRILITQEDAMKLIDKADPYLTSMGLPFNQCFQNVKLSKIEITVINVHGALQELGFHPGMDD